jgi:hypothetical protein
MFGRGYWMEICVEDVSKLFCTQGVPGQSAASRYISKAILGPLTDAESARDYGRIRE